MGMHRCDLMKRFILSVFLCLFCSASYADDSTGIVGWWKFDEASSGTCGGANILDSSGNANTGTCYANPTWVAGHIGLGAGSFVTATAQYVQTTTATNIPAINGTQTFSAWIYANASGAGTIRDILVTTNQNHGVQLRINAANQLEVSEWGGTILITETSSTISTGTWHLVEWTYNGTTNILYIDGVAQTPTNATAPPTGAPTSVVIGSYDAGEYFWGWIDDARIYNRGLALTDIQQLYDYYTGRNGLFTLLSR